MHQVQPIDRVDERVTREVRQKTWLLLIAFLVIHFLMLTARVAVVDLKHQAEIAQARLFLVPYGAAMCWAIAALLLRAADASFAHRTMVGALLSCVAAVIHAAIWALLLETLDGASYPSPASYVAYQSFYWYLFYFAWTTAYLGLSYSIAVREQARHSAVLLAEAQEAKIRALRYQVNPHFLFNTLNSVVQLYREDADAGEQMIVNISKFFRATLATEPGDQVRLADEMALQELYLRIEQVRHPDRLRYSMQVPPHLSSARVPSLLLQPLVENAVKHGVARSQQPTHIAIVASSSADRLTIRVSDDAVPAIGSRPLTAGTGVGLSNVRSRLVALYGPQYSLKAAPDPFGSYLAELSLPLIR